MQTILIDKQEREVVAYSTAIVQARSKEEIVLSYYELDTQAEDGAYMPTKDKYEFETTEYPDYDIVTTILDVHSRAIVSIEDLGFFVPNKKEVIDCIKNNKANLVGKEFEIITFSELGLFIGVESVNYRMKNECMKEGENFLAFVYSNNSKNETDFDNCLLELTGTL